MTFSFESNRLSDYLKADSYVDFEHPAIQKQAEVLFKTCQSEVEKVRAAFEFVRDEIKHTWDIQSEEVTSKASEVLEKGHGICYAKSMLLAALLRAAKVPAGLCYQKLALGDTPESGYCIHAINAVYLETLDKWIRLDARGNKEGVNAQFSLDQEQLAFPVRAAYDEEDSWMVYAVPHPIVTAVLNHSTHAIEMVKHNLPRNLFVRRLSVEDLEEALPLVKETFLEYEGPDYCDEGIQEFLNFIEPAFIKKEMENNHMQFYGYYDYKVLKGVIAMRAYTHVSLFFVKGCYHHKGIGRALFKEARGVAKEQKQAEKLTVNASPYAVKIYEHLGFTKDQEEQTVNGIRFTPMTLTI